MDFEENLKNVRRLAGTITNWDENSFTWEKAYIAAVFAAMSYEEIPEFELKKSKRAKLIPCERYQYRVSRGENRKLTETVRTLELEMAIEIVIRRKVIITIAKISEAIFVSFRGTTISFADIKSDVDIRRVRYPIGQSIKLHRGFFDAVNECFNEVMEKILFLQNNNSLPIYITGHSLGGAMAAIFYAHLRELGFNYSKHYEHGGWIRKLNSCYTFGMPRYGNKNAMDQLPDPYHIFNELDAIPTFPPRIFGFSDSRNERCLNAKSKVELIISKGDCAFRSGKGIATVLGFSDHQMDRYVERTRARQLSGS